MTGEQLTTLITGLNGGATIDATLLAILTQTGQAVLEAERDWMVLRKTSTSKSASTSNTWQTAIDISTITDFSHFLDDNQIVLFDSASNTKEYYRQVPWDRRLEYKDVSGTFVYDANTKNVYLNGVVPFSGTLYINYVSSSTLIDLTSASTIWALFPERFHPLLGFYAVGIHKGAVDYDSINKQMLPENRAAMLALKNGMEKWDDKMQASAIQFNDPSEAGEYPRSRAVNIHDN